MLCVWNRVKYDLEIISMCKHMYEKTYFAFCPTTNECVSVHVSERSRVVAFGGKQSEDGSFIRAGGAGKAAHGCSIIVGERRPRDAICFIHPYCV